jgi:hypothetical protein
MFFVHHLLHRTAVATSAALRPGVHTPYLPAVLKRPVHRFGVVACESEGLAVAYAVILISLRALNCYLRCKDAYAQH